MLKSISQVAQETLKCDYCKLPLNLQSDRWLFQDDGSYIHIDCIEAALTEYKQLLDEIVALNDIKLLSKIDAREPFGQWHETCEWCGHITDSPHETHVCKERQ